MLHSTAGHGVAEALGRLCDLAALRHPDDPLLVRFLPLYYSELPEGDVDDRKLDDIYAVAVAHLAAWSSPRAGAPVVRVLSPDRERDGWHSQHSVLLVVTDDMPFLVDTMRMVLERHGLGIHLLVHPMLSVERDGGAPPRRGRGRRRRARRGVDADRDRPHDDATAKVARGRHPRRRRRRPPGGRGLPGHARADGSPSARSTRSCRGSPPASSSSSARPSTTAHVRRRAHAARRAASSAWPATTPRAAPPRPMPGDRAVVIARTDDRRRVFRADRQTVVAVRPDRATADHASSVCWRPTPTASASSTSPASAPRRWSALDLTEPDALPHADGPPAPCSRTCPATSCWSRTRRRWPSSCRHRRAPGAPAGARLRGPRAGRAAGSPCSSTCRAAGSRPSCPSGSPTSSPRPMAPTQRTFESFVAASSLARIAVSVRRADDASARRSRPSSSGSSTTCRRRGPTACARRWWPRSARRTGRELFERIGSPRAGGVPGGRATGTSHRRHPAHRLAARRRRAT